MFQQNQQGSEQASLTPTSAAPTNANNTLQTMTSIMKYYKLVLHYLESEYRALFDISCHKNYSSIVVTNQGLNNNTNVDQYTNFSSNNSLNLSNHNSKLEQTIKTMQKTASLIQENNCKKILTNRLVNRLIQITALYRNKCAQAEPTYELRDHLNVIYGLIKQYQCQTCWQGMYGGTQSNFNPGLNSTVIYTGTSSQMNNYNFEFAGLFDKICWVFKKCTKELKQKVIKIYQDSSCFKASVSNHNMKITASSTPLNSSNSQFKQKQKQKEKQKQKQKERQKQKQKQKQKQRRISYSQTPTKSLQYKYKITKQVVAHASIFAGMDIDVTHLRALFYQAKNNFSDTLQQKVDSNQLNIRARDQYLSVYNVYRQKMKKKCLRKDKEKLSKVGQSSPIKTRNCQNKTVQKNPSVVLNSSAKMPKILQINQNNSQYYKQQNKKFRQFKNMQFLTFNRQFIQLSQIKNQKIARRPYAQVKQVLVAGDQLNYYTNKNNSIQAAPHSNCNKASFFMQRVVVKNQKISIKKKSVSDNSRMATQQ